MSRPNVYSGIEAKAVPFTTVVERAGEGQGRLSHEQRRRVTLNDLKEAARADGFAQGLAEGVEAGKVVGYEEGFRAGSEKAEAMATAAFTQEAEQFASDLASTSALIVAALQSYYERAEQELEALVGKIVADALDVTLKSDDDALLSLVRKAMAETTLSPKVRVRMNPFDVGRINKYKEILLQATHNVKDVELVEDPSITGGCVIDSEGGLIDASLSGMTQRFNDAQEAA
ncbi:MAG: hypothetical protein JST35_00115 [Armatimonadetes bacterium]|nr:hypothetical protein [Armatimonadota bacterium]